MSIAQGFTNGFRLVDDYQRKNTQEEMQKKAFGLQKENHAMQKQSHAAGLKLNAEQLKGAQNTNAFNAKKIDNYDEDRNRGIAVQDSQISANKSRQNLADYGLTSRKEADKKAKQLKLAESYFIKGDMHGFMNDESFEGTDLALLQTHDGIETAANLSKLIGDGNMSGAMVEFNNLYKSKLNRNVGKAKGRDGAIIRDIQPINLEPHDGGYKLAIRVTTDKGTYQSYISEERGIDPNDPDKKFSVDDLLGRASALGTMAEIMKTSGIGSEMQQRLGQKLGVGKQKDTRTSKMQEWDRVGQMYGEDAQKEYVMNKIGDPNSNALTLEDALDAVQKNVNTMGLLPEEQMELARKMVNGGGSDANREEAMKILRGLKSSISGV